ncbi:putative udp-glucuronosyl udp-glucosyltransferase protein [Neofusicoccum parvum UCRNP2]|uniref:Putative udp-glucuronosyl udp-glucosyltransferase protein n=1 Tax=Botryosphaeria parva (strain UCR-NP2) TaxID=1287680 RepID=R1H0V1_BOTPV|nr:putative udp-glucuronosyl udp-glucosyltransferase protein [Neofusicoccum parvum UCRNP2]
MKVPMDVMLGLQRGFHNTSKLYGEEPRQVEKVTGFSSGIKVAGKEFGTGLYEGISGIITQPLKGAKEEGAGGFIKGVGRGIAGIALKPQAAAFAIPAYTMKGIYMGIRKPFGATVQNYIIAARTAQGWEEYNKSTGEERALIVEIYRYLAAHVKKKRNPGEKEMEAIQALVQKRRQKASPQYQYVAPTHGLHATSSNLPQDTSDAQLGAAVLQKAEDEDMEEAIRQSLAEVSRGNPEEDRLIERAMRNSIAQIEKNPQLEEQYSAEEEAEVLQRVLEQSRLEAESMQQHPPPSYYSSGAADQTTGVLGGGAGVGADADELEEALRRSRLDTGTHPEAAVRHSTDSEWDSDSSPASPPTVGEIDTLASPRSTILGEVETPARGRAAAPAAHVAPSAAGGEEMDEELKQALEESEREMRGKEEADEKARREEEIVMEYVKKQSLAEEEHRRKLAGMGEGSGAGAGAGAGSGA